ncbi:hypothetical protein CYY_001614 [Polysphondylium violaceum]|uniref:Protein kinase domain-containing protein n=1 Tax=Polysphondylium violaceum TaxID=133409 RepID=A0A8J4Q0U1_9MYCE|nr:hypothetical protein CYY_001614 [Polysphondylium violaceum]
MGNHQGKTLKIGSYHLNFVKQIAEGGFSYVFLVKDSNTSKLFALKRILIRDEDEYREVKHEISIMKKLTKHKNIVKFIDFSKTSDKNNTEVFILMEYCSGGHLVELMQKRIQNKFSEHEILKIYSDICESVAYMHSQSPPIIHRDLKVENVLLEEESGLYKLCDFGSATQDITHLKNKVDMQRAEDDISRHTTIQYRAPEIVDLYRCNVITEKIDIWALGILLYKLLFYTTPFEDSGSLGILNANYTFPSNHPYSSNLINLIKLLLSPDPKDRPTIFELTNQICLLRSLPPLFPSHKSDILTIFIQQQQSSPSSSHSPSQVSPTTVVNSNSISPNQSKPFPKPLPKVSSNSNVSISNNHNNSNNHSNQDGSLNIPVSHSRSSSKEKYEILINDSNSSINNGSGGSDSGSDGSLVSSFGSMSFGAPPNSSPSPQPKRRVQKASAPLQPLQQQPFPNDDEFSNFDTSSIEEITMIINNLTSQDFNSLDTSLLIKLKTLSNQNHNIKSLMGIIVKRPLIEPLICFKSLILIQILLSEGLPSFKKDCYESKDLFNNLFLGWLKQKDRYLILGDLLGQYSGLIYKLVLFHHKYYLVDGLFGFDEMKWGLPDRLESNHPISTATITNLYEIMDQIFLVQQCLIDMSNSNTSPPTTTATTPNINLPTTLLSQCVNILNSSSFAIYCFISGCLESLCKLFSDVDFQLQNSISRFQAMYQKLRDNYLNLNTLPTFSDLFFPTLPSNPPTFIINSNKNNSNYHSNSNNSNNNNNNVDFGDNPFANEPSFNPFNTPSTAINLNNNSLRNSRSVSGEFKEPSPVISPRNSQYISPSGGSSAIQSPSMPSKKLPPRFPHSASLEDARLYTLILTPTPSPPLSPSFGRLSHSNTSVPNNNQNQNNINNNNNNNNNPTPFDNFNLNVYQPTPPSQQMPPPPSIHVNKQLPPHPQTQQQQQYIPQSTNPFDNPIPPPLNQHQFAVPQQPAPSIQKSSGSLMPPPLSKLPPTRNHHRRSQSNTTDELRRRNLLQQQLDQNRDFLNHQRLVNKNSRLTKGNENDYYDSDEFDYDEKGSLM